MLGNKLTYFAAALPQQHHHIDVGACPPRQHREQRALSATGCGIDAKPLTFSHRQQRIDGPHTSLKGPLHRPSLQRVGRRSIKGNLVGGLDCTNVVERKAVSVDNATQKFAPYQHVRLVAGPQNFHVRRQSLQRNPTA